MPLTVEFPTLLEKFFVDRLLHQRNASPHTIAGYRDTFCLLLRFAKKRLEKPPSKITLQDLNPSFILDFLDHLEKERSNSVRTRNARLAAIRSFFHYIAYEQPQCSGFIQRVLAIPSKTYERRLVNYLTREEVKALLAAPDLDTSSGRRDRALMTLALQTGLRVSELIGLRCHDITLGKGSHVRCEGKGRKERCLPLTKETAMIMRTWLGERNGQARDPVFPNARGEHLSPDGVAYLLSKHTTEAQQNCPTLKNKRVTPHVLRHTTAMNLLRAGVDCSVIALWLGHESIETTQMYLNADTEMKELILQRTGVIRGRSKRYRPKDHLLEFLKSL